MTWARDDMPDLTGNVGPQSFREQRGKVGPAKLSRLARDEDLATRLWDVSENLTGVRFAW